jgi:hypothetical protein
VTKLAKRAVKTGVKYQRRSERRKKSHEKDKLESRRRKWEKGWKGPS